VNLRIAPSILSADFTNLGAEVKAAEAGGADMIHIDVMDGHFVPNLTMGPSMVKALRRISELPLDVHLMVTDPSRYLDTFIDVGAGMLSVHVEVASPLSGIIDHIKRQGVKAGVVMNPDTPPTSISEVAADIDFAVIMTVNPGFGGQKFITGSESKISMMRRLLDAAGNSAPVEVDGGVNCLNASRLVEAGAEILVAGAAIFGASDPTAAIQALRRAAQNGLEAGTT